MYAQCSLTKELPNGGLAKLVSFIPIKWAVVGKRLRLKDSEGVWTEGWVVESVGSVVAEELLPDPHKAVKQHRKNTGDSLRK